jgi:hypothetical protein
MENRKPSDESVVSALDGHQIHHLRIFEEKYYPLLE